MIEANQLRVNNRFIREVHGFGERCTEYDPDFVLTEEMMGKLFGDDKYLALQDLFPIPLTPDLLQKCGFIEINDDGGYRHITESIFELYHNYLDDPSGYSHVWDGAFTGINVTSLHQLMNVFFYFTCKELEID